MGHFVYLVNSDVSSNNTTREALEGVRHVELEGARGVCPLPWICCFRTNDLAPCTLVSENGSKHDLQIPVISVEKAVGNLMASLPRFERLVGDAGVAREYWQHAVEAIKSLPYRFITLNVADFIFLDPGNAKTLENGFSSQADPLAGSDDLFEYHKGVHPRSLAELNGPPPNRRKRNAAYERSNHNACVLFCPRYIAAADPDLMFVRMFSQQMQNAEKGVPGCMFHVGQFYLHGRGTTKNIEEGLRWCTKAGEAGWVESARFLSFLYGNGGLGVPIDSDKAAYWKSIVEKGNGA